MDNKEKVKLLKKLIEDASSITVENSDDTNFKIWRNLVERTFIKIFSKDSTEYEHFSSLKFYYSGMTVYTLDGYGHDYDDDHLRIFREDLKILLSSINSYIKEFSESTDSLVKSALEKEGAISKVFISHSSKDVELVEEIVEILESIGLDSKQIFCTSFEGYGISLGENFLNEIKNELSSNSMVIFVLTENFFHSPICLCEMGATWVLAKQHIPIVVPPLDYKDIKGVIPLSQGFKINEPLKLNLFKEKIEQVFAIIEKLPTSTWERKRDRIIKRIELSIAKSPNKV